MNDSTKLMQYGSLIVGFDFSNKGGNGTLIVGIKPPGKAAEIINAFQGQEAIDIYNILTTRKEHR